MAPVVVDAALWFTFFDRRGAPAPGVLPTFLTAPAVAAAGVPDYSGTIHLTAGWPQLGICGAGVVGLGVNPAGTGVTPR